MNRFETVLLLGMVVLSSGCSAMASRDAVVPVTVPTSTPGASLERLGNAGPGESLELPGDHPLGTERATVSSRYVAASGRVCRRVMPADGGSERTLCRQENGDWTLVRSLDPAASLFIGRSTSMASSMGYSYRAAGVAQAAGMIGLMLEPGESLWMFALRTTGDGMNWSQIARLNAVPDPDRVEPGLHLVVPETLLTDAY